MAGRGSRVTLPVHLLVGEVPGMTEWLNELAAGAHGQGHLPASHADREQVVDVLKTAFVQGRLDRDEFDLRVGQTLVSRTWADLAALTADIPVRLVRARPPERKREPVSRAAVVATASATAALVGLFPVVMMRPPFPSYVLPAAMVWFTLAMIVPTCWVALLHEWIEKRAAAARARHLRRAQTVWHASSCG
jgi:hypothetical protein